MSTTSIGKRFAATTLLSSALALAGLGMATGIAQADPNPVSAPGITNDIKIGNRSQFVQSGDQQAPPSSQMGRPQTQVFKIGSFVISNG